MKYCIPGLSDNHPSAIRTMVPPMLIYLQLTNLSRAVIKRHTKNLKSFSMVVHICIKQMGFSIQQGRHRCQNRLIRPFKELNSISFILALGNNNGRRYFSYSSMGLLERLMFIYFSTDFRYNGVTEKS